jgi:tRNA nucleotidyltransferase (CCA-adding enzyme)
MHGRRSSQLCFAREVAQRLLAAGARECMLVGGFVRDHLLGVESKDVDVEVYGLGYDQIVGILASDYSVDLVGRSFGVVKVNNLIDINIPRRESKSGAGHKGFAIHPDPTMTPYEACARRDFTVNAMGMKFDGAIFDPFDGRKDLRRGILRATSPAFKDDPLRVLRGMQFAARFGFDMDETTVVMCREMVDEFQTLSQERVWQEWHKWAVKGRRPSKGLLLLERTGWLEKFPARAELKRTQQDPSWHPEGDVFVHTAHACDVAVEIAERESFDSQQRLVLLLAVLCHDIGKPLTTVRNDEDRWISPDHAERGMVLVEAFLNAMRAPSWVVEMVVPLVAEHMAMLAVPKGDVPSKRVVRRLSARLAPASIRLWAAVCEADASGRPPRPRKNPVAGWLAVADELALQEAQPQAILLGRHLISLGYEPGPKMGDMLKAAFEAQLDGEFQDVVEGLQWVKDHYPRPGS